jgi:DNA-binding CsgD family transcriptional regulator
MQESANINEVFTLWKEFSKVEDNNKLEFQLEIYKKLLRFFQAGDYFYVIFNLNLINLEFVSANINNVLGYQAETFTIEKLLNAIHPEDQVWFSNFEKETAAFLTKLPIEQVFDYKIQYDLRVRCADDQYKRLLFQVVTIQQYADGGIQRTLSLFTDITHLKEKGNPVLSFVNIIGGTSYINVSPGKKLIPYKEVLSKREKEILQYIIAGKLNKEIAEILFISKQTVDTHRKNMLIKTNSKNSGELIGKAISNGWI